jgi:hypothetical protein
MKQPFRAIILAFAIPCAVLGVAWAGDPLVTLSLSELEFASTAQGSASRPQDVLLTNNGVAELTISGIAITGENSGDFTQKSNCPISPATLAAKASCKIRVVFKPSTAQGGESATLQISDNASESPQSVHLSGAATAAAAAVSLSPDRISFANQSVNTTSPIKVIVLTNTGSATLTISTEISITGPAVSEFRRHSVQGGCPQSAGELPPKSSCRVGVVFSPSTTGPKTAQITIVDDAPGSPHVVPLSGTGVGSSGTQ